MNGLIFKENVVTSRICDICGNSASREFCCDCQQYFCETCKLHHLKISCLKGHRFKPLYTPEPDRVDPPSYDDALSSNYAIASAPPRDNFDETNAFQEDEEKFEYMCIECRLFVTDKDMKGHRQHTVLDVTGVRSHECIPVLVLLLQDNSSHVQNTTVDVLRRLLDKRSPAFNHLISKEEIVLIADIMLIRVIQPALQSKQELRRPLFINAVVILRNLTEIGKQEGHEGVIQHLREQRDLVNSLITTMRLYVTKLCDVDCQGAANCMDVLCNLSDDIVDEKEKEEIQVKSSGAVSLMSKLFSNKKKIKQRDEPIKSVPFPRDITEYEGLWSEPSIDLFSQILLKASNAEILQSTMNILINLIPFLWHGGRNVCMWLRKKKNLPCVVDLLGKDDIGKEKLVSSACHLTLCLISDDLNKHLIEKYAMKQVVALLPSDETTRTADDVVSTVLSILIEITSGKDKKQAHESLMEYGGIEKIKYVKFRPQNKSEIAVEEKEKASELLSILWKTESASTRYGLTKRDVKAEYVL